MDKPDMSKCINVDDYNYRMDLYYKDRIEELEAENEELKDFAIWLTGCGYDFTQHACFNKARDKLLKGAKSEPLNYPSERVSGLLEQAGITTVAEARRVFCDMNGTVYGIGKKYKADIIAWLGGDL